MGIRKSAGSILRQDVSADIFLLRGEWRVLLHLLCLSSRFSSGVPESSDVDGVALYAINHFVQTIYNDAAVGLGAVGEERVNLSDEWSLTQFLCCLTYFL